MAELSYHDYPKEPVVIDNLTAKFMKQAQFVPLEIVDNTLKIAMVNKEDFYTIDALKLAYGLSIEALEGRKEDVLEAIERLYGVGSQSIETIIEEAGRDIYEIEATGHEDVDHLRDLEIGRASCRERVCHRV